MVVTCIKQYLSNLFEAQFMKKLSNTEASWKKALPIKKRVIEKSHNWMKTRLVPSLLCRNEFLFKSIKNYAKAGLKNFLS